MFKFYDRVDEQQYIMKKINSSSDEFVYISGRRRIGKTSLIIETLKKNAIPFLYFFSSGDLTEKQLIALFVEEINTKLNDILPFLLSVEQFSHIGQVFDVVLKLAKQHRIVMVWDEFQNFWHLDRSIYSDFQKYWDLREKTGNVKTFFLGSHYTLMKEIFLNRNNPLFGRATGNIHLHRFSLDTQMDILKDYHLLSAHNVLLMYGTLFGIPKYIELFFSDNDPKQVLDSSLLDMIISADSFFLSEISTLFAFEFGGSYTKYTAILGAIASGKTKRNEIAMSTGISYDVLGQYLQKLDKYYNIIDTHTSIMAKQKGNIYYINDCFILFYFRFIYKNQSLVQLQKYGTLKEKITLGLSTYLGGVFEMVVKEMLVCINNTYGISKDSVLPFEFHTIGRYWDRNGENEIDIICVNNEEQKVLFVECKTNSNRIDGNTIPKLKQKVKDTGIFKNYQQYYGIASVDNVSIQDADICVSLEEYIAKR